MKIMSNTIVRKNNEVASKKFNNREEVIEIIKLCYKTEYPYCNSMLCNCTRNKPWFKKFKDDHIPLNETIDAISENEEF